MSERGGLVGELHPLLEGAFEDLQRAGVRWVLLREPLDLAAPPGDVDLLVDAADLPRVPHVLAARGFVPVPRPGPDVHLLAYHDATDRWLWLHLVDELRWGPCGLLRPGAERELLDARWMEGAMARLPDPSAFWVLLLHALLGRGRVREERRSGLARLAEVALEGGPFPSLVDSVAPAGWSAERVVEAVRRGEWGELEAFAPQLSASWAARSGLRGRQLRDCRVRRVLRRLRRAWALRGLTVAVVGPDGAGKSSLVQGLAKGFVFPAKVIYMGLTGGALRRVARLRVPGVVQLGHLLVFWTRWLRGQYRKARGHLVIFERYVFDAVAPLPGRQGALQRAARWAYGRSCPAPDITIILDAPGAELHRRSGEYDPPTLEHWRGCFRSLEARVPGAAVVPTTIPADQVRVEVTRRIWAHYRRRWTGAAPS